jgi:hypothetical protein
LAAIEDIELVDPAFALGKGEAWNQRQNGDSDQASKWHDHLPDNDNGGGTHYMNPMRSMIVLGLAALFGLLGLAIWFAASTFIQMSGDPIPLYGYFAIAGGVLVSLLVGGGLMALVFYSNRHGYDDDVSGKPR